MHSSRASSQPRNQTGVSCIAGDSLPAELAGRPRVGIVSDKSLQRDDV